MRISILAGVLMAGLGFAALVQTKNGFLLGTLGHLTYWPPSQSAPLAAAFDELGATGAGPAGVTLEHVAAARLTCLRRAGVTGGANAAEGFRRLNLVLLGAGANAMSPVVPPEARRVPELRGDLTTAGRPWSDPALSEAQEARLEAVLEQLIEPDAAIYRGVGLTGNFGHLDLRTMTEAMTAGGADFAGCVAENQV